MVTENKKKTEKIKDNLDFFVFFLSSFTLHGCHEIGKTGDRVYLGFVQGDSILFVEYEKNIE